MIRFVILIIGFAAIYFYVQIMRSTCALPRAYYVAAEFSMEDVGVTWHPSCSRGTKAPN